MERWIRSTNGQSLSSSPDSSSREAGSATLRARPSPASARSRTSHSRFRARDEVIRRSTSGIQQTGMLGMRGSIGGGRSSHEVKGRTSLGMTGANTLEQSRTRLSGEFKWPHPRGLRGKSSVSFQDRDPRRHRRSNSSDAGRSTSSSENSSRGAFDASSYLKSQSVGSSSKNLRKIRISASETTLGRPRRALSDTLVLSSEMPGTKDTLKLDRPSGQSRRVDSAIVNASSSLSSSYAEYRRQFNKETHEAASDIKGRSLGISTTSRRNASRKPRIGGESKESLPSYRKAEMTDFSLGAKSTGKNGLAPMGRGSQTAAVSAGPRTPFTGITIEPYIAQKPSELTVDTGDEVRISDTMSSEHWWYGSLISKDLQGWLPKSIILCDGAATPRGTSSSTASPKTTGAFSTRNTTGKRSAPMPTPLRTSSLSTGMQALISPANVRASHTNRVQGFFREDTEKISKPLRRFISWHGSEWAEYSDTEGNRYYHNQSDDQVRWQRPKSAQPLQRIRCTDGTAWSKFSLDGGKVFWFEEESGKVRASPPPVERELKSMKSLNGSQWSERVDEEGNVYWYNKTSNAISQQTPMAWSPGSSRRTVSDNLDAPECIICMDRRCCVILLPCAHANYCQECADRLLECPECRAPITYRQRFFM